MKELRPYQKECIEAIWNNMDKHIVAALPTGCHPKNEKIILSNGKIKNVQDVKLADKLLGTDGTYRKIKNLINGFGKIYKITPVKGDIFYVNEDHILSLKSTGKNYKHDIINISVKDYLAKSKWFKHCHKLYKSECEEFDTIKENLYIDPYILGIMLGDGCLKYHCSITNRSDIITDEIEKEAIRLDLFFYKKWNYKNNSYFIKIKKKRGRLNPINEYIKKLKLNKNSEFKFIPNIYKYHTKENRSKILAGLLDTDGSTQKAGFDYITKSKQLIEDIVFIARSLGLNCNITKCYKKCQGWTNKKLYYRTYITGDFSDIPLKIKIPKERTQKKRYNVTGFNIEYDRNDFFYGFKLDGNNLYFMNDFTVTHNSGKTIVLAELCKRAITMYPETTICILAPSQELVKQNYDELIEYMPEFENKISIYCAGLKSKKMLQITVATIQSIFRAEKTIDYDLILADECDLIPKNSEGMYHSFFEKHEKARIVGVSATPFRLVSGYLHIGEGRLFEDLVYNANIRDLINQGYLCNIKSFAGTKQLDVNRLHVRGGEYIDSEVQKEFIEQDITKTIINDAKTKLKGRKSIMVFCSGIEHSHYTAELIHRADIGRVEVVTGQTSKYERDLIVEEFKQGKIRFLVNCMIFTVGFNVKQVDCIILLRATKSPRLFLQMIGRSSRIHPDKKDAMVLDYGNNISTHGTIDDINIIPTGRETKKKKNWECPECGCYTSYAKFTCESCGFTREKEIREVTNNLQYNPYTGDVIGKDVEEVQIRKIKISEYKSKKGNLTAKIEYFDSFLTFSFPVIAEYIMPGSHGFTGKKAKEWCTRHGIKADSIQELIEKQNEIIKPKSLIIDKTGTFKQILKRKF